MFSLRQANRLRNKLLVPINTSLCCWISQSCNQRCDMKGWRVAVSLKINSANLICTSFCLFFAQRLLTVHSIFDQLKMQSIVLFQFLGHHSGCSLTCGRYDCSYLNELNFLSSNLLIYTGILLMVLYTWK